MELTVKDREILRFLSEFGVATIEQINTFVGCRKKNLQRLKVDRKIDIEENIIKIKNTNLSEREIKNVIGTLEILVKLYKEKEIEEIHRMDQPFIAAAKSKGEYFYFTVINKGEERLQSKIINNENKGNLVLILEEKEQVLKLELEHKVDKIYFI